MNNIDQILKWLSAYPELLSLMFYDGIRINNASYTAVEADEPGYFEALSDTFIEHLYQCQLNINTLSLESIKNLHASCTNGVLNLNTNGSGRDVSAGASFRLVFDDIQNDILQEKCYHAIEQHKDRNHFFELYYIDTNQHLVCIQDKIPRNSRIYLRNKVDAWDNAERSVTTNERRISNILSDYHCHSLSTNQPEEQIKHIVELVQRLERLHPFADANCRTFCMMLLNLELIKHGMLPSLQDDPNVFDILPIDELIERVKNGQNRFKRYCEERIQPIYQDLNQLNISINEQWYSDKTHQGHMQTIRKQLAEYATIQATMSAFLSEKGLSIKAILDNLYTQSPLLQNTVVEFLALLSPTQRTIVINSLNKNGRTLLEDSSFNASPDFFKTLLSLIPEDLRLAALTRSFPIAFDPFIRRAGQMVRHETILHRAAFNQNELLLHIAFEALPLRQRFAAATHPDPNATENTLLDTLIDNPGSLTPSIEMAKKILLLLPEDDRIKALEKTTESGTSVLNSMFKDSFQIGSAINMIYSLFSNDTCLKILENHFGSLEAMLEDICHLPLLFNKLVSQFAACHENGILFSTKGITSTIRAIFSQAYLDSNEKIEMTVNFFNLIPEGQRLTALLDLDCYQASRHVLFPPVTLAEMIRPHLVSKGLIPTPLPPPLSP